ncbi:MAG: ADP-ribosylglycohydrolase family protein [Candidatus Riflebacteria bacterium]|nr:ADP-ribosylglycohydrolase family protein [Candidatus Riflebacteria bacterium]
MKAKDARDTFRGALLGTACGDAAGMPFEFAMPPTISRVLPRISGPESRARWASEFKGIWTDDTMMTLCHARSLARLGKLDPEDTGREFVAWVDTGDLRGIGFTCHGAIKKLKAGVPWDRAGKTGVTAAGNGAAMKIAPVGLFGSHDLERLRDDCRIATLITHNCDEAFAGARAVAFAVALAARRELDPATLIDRTIAFVGPSKTAERLRRVAVLLHEKTAPVHALLDLKCGGYVVETVGASFFSFLASPDDPELAMATAVLGGFDADTTAAVTGALAGAYAGQSGLPAAWLAKLEAASEILDLADRLHDRWIEVASQQGPESGGPARP